MIVKANAKPAPDRAFGVVCKDHPDAWVREVAHLVVCSECRSTLIRNKKV